MTDGTGHGPGWTPRQREVLDLLARGRTNGQIAEALGITLDGAKWHVSEIIGKLDLDTREEAAEYWRQRQGFRARLRLLTRTGSAPALLRWLGIGGAATAAVVVVAVGGFMLLNGGDDDSASPDTSPTAVVTTTADPGVTPTATGNAEGGPLTEIGGVAVRDLSIGPEIELPSGAVLYYYEGCYACDAGGQLRRAYRRESGELVTEPIDHGLTADGTGPPLFAMSSDTTTMVAQLCDPGFCGGVGFQLGAVLHTFTSTDGGISWEEWDPPLPFGSMVRGNVGGEWLIVTNTDGGFERETTRYWLHPSFVDLPPPADDAFPMLTRGGELFWTRNSDPQLPGQTDAFGVSLPGAGVDPDIVARFAAGDLHGRAIYSATARQDFSLVNGSGVYLVATDGDRATAAFRWPHSSVHLDDRVGDRWLLGNVLYPDGQPDVQGAANASKMDYRPIFIDLESATVHSIAGLPRGDGGWSYPIDIVSGEAVLRIATNGSCLNVREAPSTEATSLRCYFDGVLLLERDVDAPDGWVAVTTPDGRDGWASAEFLER